MLSLPRVLNGPSGREAPLKQCRAQCEAMPDCDLIQFTDTFAAGVDGADDVDNYSCSFFKKADLCVENCDQTAVFQPTPSFWTSPNALFTTCDNGPDAAACQVDTIYEKVNEETGTCVAEQDVRDFMCPAEIIDAISFNPDTLIPKLEVARQGGDFSDKNRLATLDACIAACLEHRENDHCDFVSFTETDQSFDCVFYSRHNSCIGQDCSADDFPVRVFEI